MWANLILHFDEKVNLWLTGLVIVSFFVGSSLGIGMLYIFRQNKISQQLIKKKKEIEAELLKHEEKNEFYKKILEEREKNLIFRENEFLKKEESFIKKDQFLDEKIIEVEKNSINWKTKLSSLVNLSEEEAKRELFMTLEKTYQHELNRAIRQQKLYAKDAIKKITYDLVANAIEKTATEIIDTKTITFIDLPNDDFKKKIIGKDGRNIKAIMKFAEVDVIIDETPRMVKISSFDPIKREIAARSITELINSNLIQPVRIESVITQQKNNFENIISEIGNDAISELELENVHPKLIYYLGKLKFRTSYGQNVLIHSIEVGKLSGLMAAELQLNVSLAKRAGLLHDIGKAVTHEVEGSHVYHGAILAQKYGEPKEVINAIYSHHNDVEKNNLYSFLVSAADTLSAARLGARNDSLEDFITRIKEIESLCYSVSGVINAYALQSGRQICVIVNEKVIDDLMIHTVTQNIKELIRNSNIIIPGHMQITVIRELRIQEMIK